MLNPVRANYKTLQQLVTEQLHSLILSGYFPPGHKLDETELANMLEVSRMPVRMALRALAVQGLVETEAYKGTVVAQLWLEDIEDIYNLRMLLEGNAARLAAEAIQPEQIVSLQQIIEEMEDAIQTKDYSAFHTLNNAFHLQLYEAGGRRRKRLLQMIRDLRDQSALAMSTYLRSLPTAAEQAVEEHRQILDACVRRDGDEAESLTQHHLEQTMQVIMKAQAYAEQFDGHK